MKSSNMLFVVAMVMVMIPVNAIMNGDFTPAYSKRRTTDLTHCLRNKVDSNGQTILHKIVQNCDNDDFAVSITLFDFLENELPALAEEDNELRKELESIGAISHVSPELGMMLTLAKMKTFVEIKDNNGETALDIAKRRNEYSNHKRCALCVELLNKFDAMNKDAQ
jgi:hypothetical protein